MSLLGERRVVAIIPARGGSTTVPRKNIRPLGGTPLVAWSIEVARAVTAIDHTVVSTDDDAIAEVAREHGGTVARRPAELATDDALVLETVRYHLSDWRADGRPTDVVVLLEPTCPLRRPEDVTACLRHLAEGDFDSVATFTDAELNPHRAWRIEEERPSPFVEGAVPWRPRQELPEAYQLNGGAYAFFADRLPDDTVAPLFGRAGAVYMPEERSVDIDTEVDLRLANLLVEAEGIETGRGE
jgi:N-acylneuraminate cytidylyltransferase